MNLLTQVSISSIYPYSKTWVCFFRYVCMIVLYLYLYITVRIWYCREAYATWTTARAPFWYGQHQRLWCEVSSVWLAFLTFFSWSVCQLHYVWENVGYAAPQVETLDNITSSEAINPGSLTGQINLFSEIESVLFCYRWRKIPQTVSPFNKPLTDTQAQNGSYW